MSKKWKVRILNPASDTGDHTSSARALTLVMQGRAKPVDAWTIEMLDGNEQHQAAVRSAAPAGPGDTLTGASAERSRHSPNLGGVVEFHGLTDIGQTFLAYPQRDQETTWITDRHGHRLKRKAA